MLEDLSTIASSGAEEVATRNLRRFAGFLAEAAARADLRDPRMAKVEMRTYENGVEQSQGSERKGRFVTRLESDPQAREDE
ncbi:hypothetical protein NliqN6_4254 [Naganishia liquefaciens]|uniref:Uncharacterized protein n=1 Tax=Naganishia liquefaciens TaxID=104408 RepID=A0A8H3YH44_9TREE|nr:hypothetical protein NliqN6_4254 [Naganishia liquefaciens]